VNIAPARDPRYKRQMIVKPYSYRTDPAVPSFDDRAPIIVFDGLCVLCSSGVQFMLARDPQGSTRFTAIQDPVPRALYRHYGLDADRFYTFMVLADGVPHVRWQGVLAAGRTMPPPWRWLAPLGRLVPNVIGDRIYDWVQRNRIGWFGSRDTCFMPMASLRGRMLESPATSASQGVARDTQQAPSSARVFAPGIETDPRQHER
jgi:predicted DCC family thiol-disulfide oxidoreductase YuxK